MSVDRDRRGPADQRSDQGRDPAAVDLGDPDPAPGVAGRNNRRKSRAEEPEQHDQGHPGLGARVECVQMATLCHDNGCQDGGGENQGKYGDLSSQQLDPEIDVLEVAVQMEQGFLGRGLRGYLQPLILSKQFLYAIAPPGVFQFIFRLVPQRHQPGV